MRKFTWKGVEYTSIKTPMFAEMRAAETAFGDGKRAKDSQDFTALEQVIAEVYVSIKRVDPKAATWEELLNATTDDLLLLEEDEPEPETEYEDHPLDDGGPTDESSKLPSPEQVPNQ
jgi:hypothetical protein